MIIVIKFIIVAILLYSLGWQITAYKFFLDNAQNEKKGFTVDLFDFHIPLVTASIVFVVCILRVIS